MVSKKVLIFLHLTKEELKSKEEQPWLSRTSTLETIPNLTVNSLEALSKQLKVQFSLLWQVSITNINVVVQFYPWFKFYFLLFLGIVMYDNEFERKENKIGIKDKIEPQHKH